MGVTVGDEKIAFPDDLDVDWEKGFVYFSDVSTKWPFSYWIFSLIENDPSGRWDYLRKTCVKLFAVPSINTNFDKESFYPWFYVMICVDD